MKRTLELQEIVSALGIDPARFLEWQEKELGCEAFEIIPEESVEESQLSV
ncbi:hypothetical protein ABE504_25930 [Paenibacillus oryzisoli]